MDLYSSVKIWTITVIILNDFLEIIIKPFPDDFASWMLYCP